MIEELGDFFIDVFYNLGKKFKLNPVLVLMGGIISSCLFLPYIFEFFPVVDSKRQLVYVIVILLSFLFIKIYVLTVKGVKINFSTAKIIFKGLLKPTLFTVISAVVLAGLFVVGTSPVLFKSCIEKFPPVMVISATIIADMLLLILLPQIIITLNFVYDGYSIKEAFIETEKSLALGRGKIYILTILILVFALLLNLTKAGMVFLFPLIFMSLEQGKLSLETLSTEKKKAKEKKQYEYHKEHKPIKHPVKDEYIQTYNNIEMLEGNILKSGQKSLYDKKNTQDLKTAENQFSDKTKTTIESKMVSTAEYKKEDNALISNASLSPALANKENKHQSIQENIDDDLDLNDILEFGYDKENKAQEKNDEDESEQDMDIEIEYGKSEEEEPDDPNQYLTGREYIESYGMIRRKAIKAQNPVEEQKRAQIAKNYIDNFGVIKKKN